MTIRSLTVRPAFTLLEVLLASAIALLLFGGLYVAMQVELQQASAGRDVVERATLSRAIINRMTIDLSESLTPPRAKPKSKSSGQSSGNTSNTTNNTGNTSNTTNSTGATTTGMTGTTADTTSSSAATSSSSTDTTDASSMVIGAPIPLQSGVIGTDTVLTIFTTRLPGQVVDAENPDAPAPSDIRRITYWLRDGGGMCRQEIPWVTGDDVYTNSDPLITDGEDDFVIAPEVTELSFEYYDVSATTDGEGWTTSWTGSTPGPDGMTPLGPPTAIRVSFTLRLVDSDGHETFKSYKHVIPILTASGPATVDQPVPDSTDTTMSTTTTTP